jgi:hypothetical protein
MGSHSRAVALLVIVLTGVQGRGEAADPPAGGAGALSGTLAELDALHARRDEAGALARAERLVAAALAQAPNEFAVLWRAARVRFSEAREQNRPTDQRERLGKEAFELAQRATTAAPGAVEGYYWGALGVGSYGQAMGAFRAMGNGIQGKFTGMLTRAQAIDVRYDHGGIPTTWAAYYLALPWPKRDRDKAAEECRRALSINYANLRARLYLARIAADKDRKGEATALLDEIARAPVGRYDAPEERAVKREAAELRAKLH